MLVLQPRTNEYHASGEEYTDNTRQYVWREPKNVQVGDVIAGKNEDLVILSITPKNTLIYAITFRGVRSKKESRNLLALPVQARPR